MKLLLPIFIALFTGFCALSQKIPVLKKGRWVGCLELSADDHLFFELELHKKDNAYSFTVLNGKEKVPMNRPYVEKDSIHIFFTNFNSELVFQVKNKKSIEGKWVNHLKTNYSIPFRASLSSNSIFPVNDNVSSVDFSGKWKTVFSPGEKAYDAIGVFDQKGNHLTGTFLTETGDYRFLSGNTEGKKMYLSGFDGSHAYLFKGDVATDGTIDGQFFSGKHYKTNWQAERNEQFELRHPDSLTRLVGDPNDLSLQFKHLDGTTFSYPNDQLNGKVVIIQILGTWCGNCMDETAYFKELHKKYNEKGLEIVSVGYELGEGFDDFAKHLSNYKKRFDLKHTIVVGGSANKSSAKGDFGFLSDFTSFPTSIFIDRNGRVVRIHTGFSGPSTGKYYTDYKEKTEQLIELLINE